MKTRLCEMFGIEFPIFAFSHCRDVVAAVTNAGGIGVLGALAFSPERLELELKWIDEHVNGKPYGGAPYVEPTKAPVGAKAASGAGATSTATASKSAAAKPGNQQKTTGKGEAKAQKPAASAPKK